MGNVQPGSSWRCTEEQGATDTLQQEKSSLDVRNKFFTEGAVNIGAKEAVGATLLKMPIA